MEKLNMVFKFGLLLCFAASILLGFQALSVYKINSRYIFEVKGDSLFIFDRSDRHFIRAFTDSLKVKYFEEVDPIEAMKKEEKEKSERANNPKVKVGAEAGGKPEN